MPPCSICNSPFHNSETCNQKKNTIQCFNCGGNHKRIFCTHSSTTHNNNNIRCFTCNKYGHKKDTCPNNQQYTYKTLSNNNNNNDQLKNISYSVQEFENDNKSNLQLNYRNDKITEIKLFFNGWWGNQSALVHPDCILSNLKVSFITNLIEFSAGKIPNQLDNQNKTGHVKLRENKDDIEGTNLYNTLHNTVLQVTVSSFNIKNDYVSLPVGLNKHFTLFYYKDLLKIVDAVKIKQILNELITLINTHNLKEKLSDEQIKYYLLTSNNNNNNIKPSEQNNLCVICIEYPKSILLRPCKHVCVCDACAKTLSVCPICTTEIKEKEIVYVS